MHNINTSEKCDLQNIHKKCAIIDGSVFTVLLGFYSLWVFGLTFYQHRFFSTYSTHSTYDHVDFYTYSKCVILVSF